MRRFFFSPANYSSDERESLTLESLKISEIMPCSRKSLFLNNCLTRIISTDDSFGGLWRSRDRIRKRRGRALTLLW